MSIFLRNLFKGEINEYIKYNFKELEENKLSTLIEQSGFDKKDLMASFWEVKIRDEYFGLKREFYRWVIS